MLKLLSKKNGFRKANTFLIDSDTKKCIHADGHHRLAAAIELGYSYVPYRRVVNTDGISEDSWAFRAEDEAYFRRTHSRILHHPDNPTPLCKAA